MLLSAHVKRFRVPVLWIFILQYVEIYSNLIQFITKKITFIQTKKHNYVLSKLTLLSARGITVNLKL